MCLCFIAYRFIIIDMSEKNSAARKKYWVGVPSEVRTKRMSLIAKKRFENMSIEDRKLLGSRLALARKNKNVKNTN